MDTGRIIDSEFSVSQSYLTRIIHTYGKCFEKSGYDKFETLKTPTPHTSVVKRLKYC